MNNEALRFRVCRLAMRKSMKFASHWELITNNQQITHQSNIQSLLFFAWVLLLLIESNFIFILFFRLCPVSKHTFLPYETIAASHQKQCNNNMFPLESNVPSSCLVCFFGYYTPDKKKKVRNMRFPSFSFLREQGRKLSRFSLLSYDN